MISTVSSRILNICWPRWPINFLLSSSDLKQGLFSGRYALLNLRSKWYSTLLCTWRCYCHFWIMFLSST
jgi:hypothetical protein